MRGRTDPPDAGRAVTVALILAGAVDELPEGLALPAEGLLPDEGLLDDGLVPADGALVFGVAGFSAAGGTFWATGASL